MSTEPGLPRRRDEAPPQDDSPPGPERLLALSDGVVAIALTLLILDLKVPATSLLRHPRLGVQPDRAARARHRPADQLRGVVLRHRPVLAHAPPGIPRGHRAQRRAGLVEFRVPVHHHADPVHQRACSVCTRKTRSRSISSQPTYCWAAWPPWPRPSSSSARDWPRRPTTRSRRGPGRSRPSAWPRSWRCPWRSRGRTRTPPNTCGS
jgi:hypothetical protein